MKGHDGDPLIKGGNNTVRQIRSNNMMEKPKLDGFWRFLGGFSPEGEVTTLWEGLLGWRAQAKYWKQIREM